VRVSISYSLDELKSLAEQYEEILKTRPGKWETTMTPHDSIFESGGVYRFLEWLEDGRI